MANPPVFVMNSTKSSYCSRFTGRKVMGTDTLMPGHSLIDSGNSMLKYLVAGRRYLSRTFFVDTFFSVSSFVYSPPGLHPRHSIWSAQSKPKLPSMPQDGSPVRNGDGVAGQRLGSPGGKGGGGSGVDGRRRAQAGRAGRPAGPRGGPARTWRRGPRGAAARPGASGAGSGRPPPRPAPLFTPPAAGRPSASLSRALRPPRAPARASAPRPRRVLLPSRQRLATLPCTGGPAEQGAEPPLWAPRRPPGPPPGWCRRGGAGGASLPPGGLRPRRAVFPPPRRLHWCHLSEESLWPPRWSFPSRLEGREDVCLSEERALWGGRGGAG